MDPLVSYLLWGFIHEHPSVVSRSGRPVFGHGPTGPVRLPAATVLNVISDGQDPTTLNRRALPLPHYVEQRELSFCGA